MSEGFLRGTFRSKCFERIRVFIRMAVPPREVPAEWFVIGNVVRNAEETFLGEVSLGDEVINVMCKKKHLI
jgi:hypothetical protein